MNPNPTCGWCKGNPIGDCIVCQSPMSTPETYNDDPPQRTSDALKTGDLVDIIDGLHAGARGRIVAFARLSEIGVKMFTVHVIGIRTREIREDFMRRVDEDPCTKEASSEPVSWCPFCVPANGSHEEHCPRGADFQRAFARLTNEATLRPDSASPRPASDYDAGLATAERIVRKLAEAERNTVAQACLYNAADHIGSAVFTHPLQRPEPALLRWVERLEQAEQCGELLARDEHEALLATLRAATRTVVAAAQSSSSSPPAK